MEGHKQSRKAERVTPAMLMPVPRPTISDLVKQKYLDIRLLLEGTLRSGISRS